MRRAGGARGARPRAGAGHEATTIAATSPRARCRWRRKTAPRRRGEAGGLPRRARRRRWRRFPQDEELWLQRGQAESPDPGRARAGQRRRVDPRSTRRRWRWRPAHFAAHHYLTHAYENSGRHQRGADARRRPMRRWRPACRTRGTCTATTCGASAGSTRRSTEFRAADALETGVLRGREGSGRVRLALPAQSGSAGDVVSVHRPDGEGRGAAEDVVRHPVVAAWCRSSTSASGRCSCSARGRAQEALDAANVLAGAPVAGGQRDRARRGRAARGSRSGSSRRRPTRRTRRCG